MKNNKKRLFLIDGNAFCYRAFYAIKDLRSSKGFPTNAIYGVISMLKKMITGFEPEMMAVVFDTKGPTERHRKFGEYKIHRKPMPDDLILQFPRIKEVIKANNIAMFELPGHEADDIIATLAEKAVLLGLECVVVTSDKDALQLVGGDISVLSPEMKENKVYGKEEVIEKFGVPPEAMTELMALTGDASDNVPGVDGIGAVTAKKLINEYGTIDELYLNIDKLGTGAVRKKLEEGKESAFLSRELVTLIKDLPVDLDLDKVRMSSPDTRKLAELYTEFEFRGLMKETGLATPEKDKTGSVIHRSEEEIKKLCACVAAAGKTAIRIAPGDRSGKVAGIALSWKEKEVHYVPLPGEGTGGFKALKKIIEAGGIAKYGHNMKRDIALLASEGMALDGIAIDVMIADYLLLPNFPDHELSGIAVRRLGYALPEAGVNKVKWESSGQGTMDFDGTVAMDEAVLEEACAILVLAEPLEKELKEKGLYELFTGLEMPLISVIGGMENEGVGIDIEHMEKTSVELDEKIRLSTAKIYDMAGGEFNINSPKQLQRILFDELKLPVMKKTKTGASTDESVLSQLAPLNALPALILEHRALTKLKTTYYDAILRMVDRKTGRLHTTFNQAVAATGRLSSSDPNLQNIPVKTELGREIRKAFISPRKDEVLIAADYSQIELRVLAHLSGDKNLIKAFNKDEDIHKFTASLIFDVALDAVTDKMRSSAKTVNFGILYGMGAFSLSKDLEISVDEAQKFIDSYFERYEGVKKFIDSTLEKARKDGYVTTILGRRRDIPEISSPNIQVKGFAERAAMNTPVQGSAADIIKLAMLGCSRELKNAVMILQVHDELIFSCRKKDVSHASGEIRKRMESVMELKVPLKVDVEWGKNWLEMADVS